MSKLKRGEARLVGVDRVLAQLKAKQASFVDYIVMREDLAFLRDADGNIDLVFCARCKAHHRPKDHV